MSDRYRDEHAQKGPCHCNAYQHEVAHHRETLQALDKASARAEKAEQERDALRAELAGAQTRVQELTGLKFSDRMWHALRSRAEVAERELAAVRGGWIGVKERMPEIGSTVLTYDEAMPQWPVREMRYSDSQYHQTAAGRAAKWKETSGTSARTKPTHWRPLPAPPASAGDGRGGGECKECGGTGMVEVEGEDGRGGPEFSKCYACAPNKNSDHA